MIRIAFNIIKHKISCYLFYITFFYFVPDFQQAHYIIGCTFLKDFVETVFIDLMTVRIPVVI